ncbi:TetR/AcrR family transcriptional regulator [Streptacidiphilus albus]|uniref:TetR/AcrR family transcriptional regulator n=1 Tax=Streptacidiphilus albus TaxID=105425 RepID=UPI0006903A81|nr:TetR/AcrR family transcriptional regulator [Streptacidiphilus albus]
MKQDRARRTHALLLDAAAVEFAAHGATAGSLDRVAERTGLTKGALYGHFPSKAALVSELLAQFEAVWRELLHHADTVPGSALAALDRLLLELAQRLGDDPRFSCGMRLIVDAAQVEGQVPSQFPELRDRFTQLAVRAQQAGELLRDPSAEVVGDTMLAILVGVRHTTPSGCPDQLVARVTELRDALLTGRIRRGE